MGVRLTAVTLQGFQAYGERVEVDVDPHLTVIAGRNNVGKSALLRALRLGVEPAEGLQPDFSLGLTWTGQPAVMSKYPRFRDAFRGLAAVYTTVRPGTAGPNVGLSSIVVDVGGEVSPTLPADVQTLPESWAKYLDPGDAPQVETALKTFATEQLGTVKAMRARPSDHTPTPTGPQRNLNPSADNLANVFLWINNNEFETHRRLCTALSRAFPEVVRVEAPLTTAHVEVVVRMRHVADPVPQLEAHFTG